MQIALTTARRRLGFLRETPVGTAWRASLGLWRTLRSLDRRTLRNRIGERRTLARLRRLVAAAPADFDGTVLIDGTWYNPNFFVRLSLLRAALGTRRAREVVIVREDLAELQMRTFRRLGFTEFRICPWRAPSPDALDRAKAALRDVTSPEEFLAKRFSPPVLTDVAIYDGILKITRQAEIDVRAEQTAILLARFFDVDGFVRRTLEEVRPDVVALSHAVHFFYGSLACQAASRGIKTVLVQGRNGLTKFVQIKEPEDVYEFEDRPRPEDVGALSVEREAGLLTDGAAYLERRLGGNTGDIGAVYAFHRRKAPVSRSDIVQRFGWDPALPICGVYFSNWYDFPHACGMRNFNDFLDFARVTLEQASAQPSRNFLLKAHPCDDWYGGITLEDLVSVDSLPNVAMADKSWGGQDLLRALDMFVTVHGTVGIEAASLGKPVLLADRGWYHDLGLAHWTPTRDAYIGSFRAEWWRGIDADAVRRRALVLAGAVYATPSWQRHWLLPDDSLIDDLYTHLPLIIDRATADELPRELRLLRAWFQEGGEQPFHTYKRLVA